MFLISIEALRFEGGRPGHLEFVHWNEEGDAMEILSSNRMDGIIKELGFEDEEASQYQDSELRNYVTCVDVLSKILDGVLSTKEDITQEELFYSQYYWFNKFVNRYIELFGPNAGLEQQLFKMLEHYNEYISENIDWDVIEKIDNGSI